MPTTLERALSETLARHTKYTPSAHVGAPLSPCWTAEAERTPAGPADAGPALRVAQVGVQVSVSFAGLPEAMNPKVVLPPVPTEPFHVAFVATTPVPVCFRVV